ncbi:MAG: hypothetical protein P1V20_06245 [Verrucomicrobiales bacterium]|nr:hypothetical protein [Verrucomicrobiales bacterium]
MKQSSNSWLIAFAVVLPAIAFLIEFTSGFCANTFLDPIPRWPLIIAVALVPVIFLLHVLKQAGRLEVLPPRVVNFLVAATVPLSLYYCIVFGTLLIMGAFAILAFGMGLLPLTPLFTLIFGLKVISRDKEASWRRSHFAGLAFGALFVLFAEGPSWVTYSQITRIANDDSRETVESAVKICERIGSEKSAFLQCASSSFHAAEPVEFFFEWSSMMSRGSGQNQSEAAELLYYYLSGKTVNKSGYTKRFGVRRENWDWDNDHGGDTTGMLQHGLRLDQSIISSKIESAAGLIYQEWTVNLVNNNPVDREGRALIKLPKGSVVSRLTLWVNGEPREAAFAKKEKVTAAYQKVAVQQRRDPVLVRWAGPDRIFVQCFPVPRNGGSLKYRIGFISRVGKEGKIYPPRFLERNFEIAKSFDHTVRFQSDGTQASLSDDLDVVPHPKQGTVLMGQLRNRDILSGEAIGTASTQAGTVWAKDDLDPQKRILVREPAVEQVAKQAEFDLIYVIDGSGGMKQQAASVADAIRNGAANPENTGVVIATRTGGEVYDFPTAANRETMASKVQKYRYRGGVDNAFGLVEAIKMAKPGRHTEIVWIHGPQPVRSENSSVVQMLNQLSVKPKVKIHSFSVHEGKNYILRKLMESPALRHDQPVGNLQEDISALRGMDDSAWQWKHLDTSGPLPENRESSNILARYWAYQKVMSELYNHTWDREDTEFAALYQLVTPFTGAVVLETKQQFTDNGLKAVDSETTTKAPSVPEPEFYLLLLTVALVAVWMNRYRLFQLCQFAQ